MSSRKISKSENSVKSRRAILDALKLDGCLSASILADRLDVSPMAVRQHLYALSEEGFVSFEERSNPVGRPTKEWFLTDAAQQFFPDAHAELTSGLLSVLRQTFGDAGLDKIIKARSREQIEAYSAEMREAKTLSEALAILAGIRSREGYMATIENVDERAEGEDEAWLLIENHCPICTAAAACSGLCDGELSVFKAVLGPKVMVERVDYILAGAKRCAYRITPV